MYNPKKSGGGDTSNNTLRIHPDTIQENIKKIANEQGIDDFFPVTELDFSVEMETGTGKTYVYLRTIFQLYKQYGLHKFIIVVPSIAIREGVLVTLRDTKQHFHEIYGTHASFFVYNSKRLSDVRNFCETNHLSIMVMNKQAFDSDKKIINNETREWDNLLEKLQKVKPIIIMDEPQEGMDSENMQKRLAAFNPLFKLRYSATHRHPKNLVHRLTPYDAYNDGLVKKISVLSIHETGKESNVAIKFHKINLGKGYPTATLSLQVRLKGGEIKEKKMTIKVRDDLELKTNNPVYKGWMVESDGIGTTDIFDGDGYIQFTNGERIEEGNTSGSDKETIFRQQIHRTIENHFKRKEQLVPLGIINPWHCFLLIVWQIM